MKRYLLACLVLLIASNASTQDSERQQPTVTSADLRITLSAVKPRVLVGEFTKVKADWLALRHVAMSTRDPSVLLDDGTGFIAHAEASSDGACLLCGVSFLAEGNGFTTEHVVGLKQLKPLSYGFAFPRPGLYFVKLRLDEVESNVVAIEVVAPTGPDAEILTAVQAHIAVLAWGRWSVPELQERATSLVERYGGHVYLAFVARTLYWGDPFYGKDRDFARLSAIDFGDSVFAADEALRLARIGRQSFGDAWAIPAYQRVMAIYPGRTAAMDAEADLSRLEDRSPRFFVGVARPLWPANGKLAPVHVEHWERGVFKKEPVVLLQSITCDDNCNPAADIRDADFGSEDFDFRLRATDSPDGRGRTYTITYSVRSANGELTAVTSTAIVPCNR